MTNNKLLSLLGIAMKAGKIASGEYATENEVKCGSAHFVIIAEDASNNTKKKFSNMCEFYQVPYTYYGTREILGHTIGKEFRATLAVLDGGFANGVRNHLGFENQSE